MTEESIVEQDRLHTVGGLFLSRYSKIHYIPTAHPGSRYFYLQEEYHVSRKKKPQTLPELYAANFALRHLLFAAAVFASLAPSAAEE